MSMVTVGFLKEFKAGKMTIPKELVIDLPKKNVEELEAAHPNTIVRLMISWGAMAIGAAYGFYPQPLIKRSASFRVAPCPACQKPGERMMLKCGFCDGKRKVLVVP